VWEGSSLSPFWGERGLPFPFLGRKDIFLPGKQWENNAKTMEK
jgi:hypothetical protein